MLKLCSSLVLLIACAACGSSFTVTDGGGSAGSGNAGEANGGQSSSAGTSSGGDAGETDVGGTSSGGDGGSTAAGAGGTSSGGSGASAGAGSGVDCAKLKQDYQAALEKARACDKGSTDQCSPSSTIEPLSCGCAVLVNAKSEYTAIAKKARQAFRDAKCAEGVACSAIACAPISEASCAAGLGTASSFVCTAATLLAN